MQEYEMNIDLFLSEQKNVLEKDIRALEAQIKKLPEDDLYCFRYHKNGSDYVAWYRQHEQDNRHVRTYIPKRDVKSAKLLARKTYVRHLLDDKKNELASINLFLDNRRTDRHSKMLEFDSPYRELLFEKNDWEYEEYEKSSDHPENLIVPAPKGEMMRSKSEAMIAQALFSHQIPYRYEYVHYIQGHPIASDFTILHPKNGREVIWEHFGRISEQNYVDTTTFKINKYIKAGYVPGYDLIMTFETREHPLSYMEVEETIKKYFL